MGMLKACVTWLKRQNRDSETMSSDEFLKRYEKQWDELYNLTRDYMERNNKANRTLTQAMLQKDINNVKTSISIAIAELAGVSEEKILRTKEDIDRYFNGEDS